MEEFLDRNRGKRELQIKDKINLSTKYIDPMLDDIIDIIIEKEGYTRLQVWAVISHFFNWQRNSIYNREYVKYYWPNCGFLEWFARTEEHYPSEYKEDILKFKESRRIIDRNIIARKVSNNEHSYQLQNKYEEMLKEYKIPEEKKDVIDDILKFTPEQIINIPANKRYDTCRKAVLNRHLRQYDYRQYGWYIKGKINKGGWNIVTMGEAKREDLIEFLKLLRKYNNNEPNTNKTKERVPSNKSKSEGRKSE